MDKETISGTQTNSVLSNLIRDESIVVRLIKQDILTSFMLQQYNVKNDISSCLELNEIIYELLLLDRSSNREEAIDFYNKHIEGCCKMLADFPKISLEELALNCFIEIKNVRRW